MSRPRIEEVAARAGTSAITVSRALRDPSKVAPATRARVMAAIAALGYIPNLSASSLASRRSGIVGLLVPTIDNSIFAATVQGLTDAIATAGLQLLLGDFRYSEEGEKTLVRALVGRQPEALVVVGVVRDAALRSMLLQLAIPVIETWDLTAKPVDIVVGFSNKAAGAAMARHLLSRGHRRLAFVGGRDHRAAARAQGFATALKEAGAPAPLIESVDSATIADGRRALAHILSTAPKTEGVFFATDVLAVGGLLECQSRGIAVPKRLAVAGLGDLEIARELSPALTTVRIPAYEIGRRAGEIVVGRLRGEAAGPRVVDLGFSVLVRDST
ncbi:LacI family transcriptional regulator, gluconate utilization system Gnt-I transcriptional repressor [Enhydrobacter aerosaccus]|uniref:LacI family transcriptional regulator, gluconate utilization system Gnt-I transcriptional repressor n=1 Tax=Enhydrobacter aerosaccus TaxID=225324 RepID=A0A1T4SZV1_9HYPH|nr:LacI family DNA-binding transcriptional regulator [Enhydrobacter aerosaccus]SKA33468.1 LacI family transcriptional regulator, gluconate utilization system Gnt-I transcriptional repressor [Enhydrobacter aerosaccus]